jgi:hypothetical protein
MYTFVLYLSKIKISPRAKIGLHSFFFIFGTILGWKDFNLNTCRSWKNLISLSISKEFHSFHFCQIILVEPNREKWEEWGNIGKICVKIGYCSKNHYKEYRNDLLKLHKTTTAITLLSMFSNTPIRFCSYPLNCFDQMLHWKRCQTCSWVAHSKDISHIRRNYLHKVLGFASTTVGCWFCAVSGDSTCAYICIKNVCRFKKK